MRSTRAAIILLVLASGTAVIANPNPMGKPRGAPVQHRIDVSVVTKSSAGKYIANPASPPLTPLWTVQTQTSPTCKIFPATWMPNMVSAPLEGACVYVSDAWSPPGPAKFNEWAYTNANGSICRDAIATGITSGTGKFSVQIYAANLPNQSRQQTLTSSIASVRISSYYNHPSLPNGILTSVVWYDGFAKAPGC